MKVGFIGLGNMGGPMAANLVKAGHDVTGFDPAGQYPQGVAQTSDAVNAASGADVVITMLPSGAILRDVARRIIPVLGRTCQLFEPNHLIKGG